MIISFTSISILNHKRLHSAKIKDNHLHLFQFVRFRHKEAIIYLDLKTFQFDTYVTKKMMKCNYFDEPIYQSYIKMQVTFLKTQKYFS